MYMKMQNTGENDARKQGDAGDGDGRSDEGEDEGDGDGGQGGGCGDTSDAGRGAWGEMMREHGEDGEGGSSGDKDRAVAMVGVGRARERAGPGKWRRVATLARWEPSARAHMLSHLEDATADVTGD